MELIFTDIGLARLSCIVMDGYDADSVVWMVQVEPNGIANESRSPLIYALYNSYPNPFNIRTVIPFQLPESAIIEFNLYDINGRKVNSLSHRRYNAGHHRLILAANNLSSGVYLLRMKLFFLNFIRIQHSPL